VKVGGTPQVSGTTSNNFTSPVTYAVTAQDNATTKDWTVTVTVTPPATYALTMAVSPSGEGTATDKTGNSPYTAGAQVSIKAVANAGYQFVDWTSSPSSGTFTSATSATTTFTMPANAVTVTANFKSIGTVSTTATNNKGSVMVTGNITASTVSLNYPGPSVTSNANIPFGMFIVGRNPGTGWDTTGTDYGTVTVVNNSDPNPTWTLSVFSENDGGGNFSNGMMYCNALSRYLDNAMYVSLNNGGTYNQLPTGVTATGNVTTNFQLSAAQNVTQNDVNVGAGSYYIVVQLTASVTP
jgi:uncharacterized repeat protein (TIGR02543 family)